MRGDAGSITPYLSGSKRLKRKNLAIVGCLSVVACIGLATIGILGALIWEDYLQPAQQLQIRNIRYTEQYTTSIKSIRAVMTMTLDGQTLGTGTSISGSFTIKDIISTQTPETHEVSIIVSESLVKHYGDNGGSRDYRVGEKYFSVLPSGRCKPVERNKGNDVQVDILLSPMRVIEVMYWRTIEGVDLQPLTVTKETLLGRQVWRLMYDGKSWIPIESQNQVMSRMSEVRSVAMWVDESTGVVERMTATGMVTGTNIISGETYVGSMTIEHVIEPSDVPIAIVLPANCLASENSK
jgi:hypothetical protein